MNSQGERALRDALHDLRQPVSALRLYAEWLTEDHALAPELAPKLLRAARAAEAQFDAVLEIARLDAGMVAIRHSPVALDELLSELEAQLRPLAMQKGLALRVRALPVTVEADPVVLRRMLVNLMANAIRYTPRGGILLAARRRGDAVSVEVWDTGVGIAESEHERVFDDFYRGHESDGAGESGLGLGLAIVQRLAGRAGLPVSMHSRLERGTVFKLLLQPWADGAAPPAIKG
jgi:signal transduction histidine kinase